MVRDGDQVLNVNYQQPEEISALQRDQISVWGGEDLFKQQAGL